MSIPITFLEEVDSTSTWIQTQLDAGARPPFAVLAAMQTSGRGRRGRQWSSPPGNIYLSIAIPASWCGSENSMRLVPLRAAVLIAKSIQKITGIGLTIKWPNDLLFAGAKVAGILCEGTVQGDKFGAPVIGVGINCTADRPHPLGTSLKEISGWAGDVRALGQSVVTDVVGSWTGLDDEALIGELALRGIPAGSIWRDSAPGGNEANWYSMNACDESANLKLRKITFTPDLEQSPKLIEVSSANHEYMYAYQCQEEVTLPPPLLIADVGNTRAKLALWSPSTSGKPLAEVAVVLAETRGKEGVDSEVSEVSEVPDASSGTDLEIFLTKVRAEFQRRNIPLVGWPVFAVSVNSNGLKSLTQKLLKSSLVVVSLKKRQMRLVSEYDLQSLGADRLAAMECWLGESREPAVIVSAGTAITVDVLGESGRHLGGFIAPGISTSLKALNENTALLPLVSPATSADCLSLGTTTRTSILGGVGQMAAGLIIRAIELSQRQGVAGSQVIITGGDGSLVASLVRDALAESSTQVIFRPDMVLQGARQFALGGSIGE